MISGKDGVIRYSTKGYLYGNFQSKSYNMSKVLNTQKQNKIKKTNKNK